MNINHLITDWAYRVNNGMPDPKNRNHIELLEAVLRDYKYSEEFINEYILSMLLTEGSTAATTFYHEIISGIAAVKNISITNVDTPSKIKKYFDNGTIAPVSAGLGTIDIMSLKQGRFLEDKDDKGKPQFPDKKIVADAIKSGKAIASKLKYSKAYWAGPTNDASDFGAADIILSKGAPAKGVGVSLKYGKGQLKNLSSNQFFQAVMPNAGVNIMHTIYKNNIGEFDRMTRVYISEMQNIVNGTKDKDAINAFKLIKSISTWESYQKGIISPQDAEKFVKVFPKLDVKKLKTVKYFGRKLASNMKDWKNQRKEFFDTFFGTFINANKDKITKNLGTLLIKQLSINENPLWYSASGGSDLKLLPGAKQFKEIAKTISLDFDNKVTGSGYDITLIMYHQHGPGGELGKIKISIRWKQGQMVGFPDTASSAKWTVSGDDWQRIFT